MVRALPPAVLPLLAASLAFLAAQGFGRFGFGLVLPAMRDGLGLSTGQMGLLAGIGLTAYLLSSVPAGAPRIGVVIGLPSTALANADRSLESSMVGINAPTSDSRSLCSLAARRTSTLATGPTYLAISISTPASTTPLQPVGGGALGLDTEKVFGSDGAPAAAALLVPSEARRDRCVTIVASEIVLATGCA